MFKRSTPAPVALVAVGTAVGWLAASGFNPFRPAVASAEVNPHPLGDKRAHP